MTRCLAERCSLANLLPPVFICTVTGTIWSIYFWLHLWRMLELRESKNANDQVQYDKGLWQTCISQSLTAMFLICFVRCLLGEPGSVPDEPEWMLGAKGGSSTEHSVLELKGSTGDRRFCKWCQKYKPDRCHHCRICKCCILRMDHHCPWIMNCVGFRNHKYFFLLVVYAVLNCSYIMHTLRESVQRAVEEETPSAHRFLLVLGFVLAGIMGALMGAFLAFHTWLMFRGMTTIEYCEKVLGGQSHSGAPGSRGVSYNLGLWLNVKAVLGNNPLLWCLPVSPPEGSGISFPSADQPLLHRGLAAKGTPHPTVEPEWAGNDDDQPTVVMFPNEQS